MCRVERSFECEFELAKSQHPTLYTPTHRTRCAHDLGTGNIIMGCTDKARLGRGDHPINATFMPCAHVCVRVSHVTSPQTRTGVHMYGHAQCTAGGHSTLANYNG